MINQLTTRQEGWECSILCFLAVIFFVPLLGFVILNFSLLLSLTADSSTVLGYGLLEEFQTVFTPLGANAFETAMKVSQLPWLSFFMYGIGGFIVLRLMAGALHLYREEA